MCDYCSEDFGYICKDCLDELKYYLRDVDPDDYFSATRHFMGINHKENCVNDNLIDKYISDTFKHRICGSLDCY